MTRTQRLDLELVRRGLTGSRAEAQRAIEDGKVLVRGLPADKASSLVSPEDAISLAAEPARFVSRGGDKLDGALARLDVEVRDRHWLDAGASTGGFSDRLLQGGASEVVALDVGYGQLDWKLRNDDRVIVMERKNVRELTPGDLPWRPDGVVADLSFISLETVLPALAAVPTEGADLVLLVKPQFEVGKDDVGKGGVVKDPELWRRAIERVTEAASECGLGLVDVALAEPAGPAGNREFFVHLRRGGTPAEDVIAREIGRALG